MFLYFFFLNSIFFCSVDKSRCEWWPWWSKNTSNQWLQEKLCRNISTQVLQQRLFWNTSTRLQRKLQSGIQVSKLAQRKLYSGMCTSTQGFFFCFFFWSRVNVEKQSQGNGMEVFKGRNGPGLDGYLRWKLSTNSLACSSSVAGNHLESLSVSLYPSHITL